MTNWTIHVAEARPSIGTCPDLHHYSLITLHSMRLTCRMSHIARFAHRPVKVSLTRQKSQRCCVQRICLWRMTDAAATRKRGNVTLHKRTVDLPHLWLSPLLSSVSFHPLVMTLEQDQHVVNQVPRKKERKPRATVMPWLYLAHVGRRGITERTCPWQTRRVR